MTEQDEVEIDSILMGEIADDALTLFRVNLFLIGVYVSIVAFLFQSEGEFAQIKASKYTLVGLAFWTGSIGMSIFTYRGARLLATATLRSDPTDILNTYSQTEMAKNISATALGTLIAVFSLAVGVQDGLTSTGIPIIQPLIVFMYAAIAVVITQASLGMMNAIVEMITRFVKEVVNIIHKGGRACKAMVIDFTQSRSR